MAGPAWLPGFVCPARLPADKAFFASQHHDDCRYTLRTADHQLHGLILNKRHDCHIQCPVPGPGHDSANVPGPVTSCASMTLDHERHQMGTTGKKRAIHYCNKKSRLDRSASQSSAARDNASDKTNWRPVPAVSAVPRRCAFHKVSSVARESIP